MSKVSFDVKLDFKDVLIRPKRSTLKSRAQVSLERTYTFKNSGKTWTGVPIIAANMDTTGTMQMASALAKHQLVTALHKHYDVDDWKAFANAEPTVLPYVCASSGTSDEDWKKLSAVLDGTVSGSASAVQFICLDVANGYSEHFVNFVRKCREAYPKHTIFA